MQKAPPRLGRGFAKSTRIIRGLLLDKALGQQQRLAILTTALQQQHISTIGHAVQVEDSTGLIEQLRGFLEILDEGRGSHAVGTVPAREPEAVGSRVQDAGSGAAASGAARDEDRIEQP